MSCSGALDQVPALELFRFAIPRDEPAFGVPGRRISLDSEGPIASRLALTPLGMTNLKGTSLQNR